MPPTLSRAGTKDSGATFMALRAMDVHMQPSKTLLLCPKSSSNAKASVRRGSNRQSTSSTCRAQKRTWRTESHECIIFLTQGKATFGAISIYWMIRNSSKLIKTNYGFKFNIIKVTACFFRYKNLSI